jgi:hypothetical protein
MVVDIAFELLFAVSFLSNIVFLYLVYMFWDDAASSRSELNKVKRQQAEDRWFEAWRDDSWDDLDQALFDGLHDARDEWDGR